MLQSELQKEPSNKSRINTLLVFSNDFDHKIYYTTDDTKEKNKIVIFSKLVSATYDMVSQNVVRIPQLV
jgi:hypothetical protein